TKGSRMKASITAASEVMKNTRPKYRMAIPTPNAISGAAMLRTSCSAARRGLDKMATKRDPCLESTMPAFIMKSVFRSHAIPKTPHPGSRPGKEAHWHGHQRSPRYHRARASQSGAHHQTRRFGRTRPPGGGARRCPDPGRKPAAHE